MTGREANGEMRISATILSWALHSEAIALPVTLPNGKAPKGIEDFKV